MFPGERLEIVNILKSLLKIKIIALVRHFLEATGLINKGQMLRILLTIETPSK